MDAVLARPGQSLSGISAASVLQRLEPGGAILLRGFSSTRREFERFSSQLCSRFHLPATRDGLAGDGSDGATTSTPQGNFTLFAHTEASYRPFAPPQLAFLLCLEAPRARGGETILVDGRAFLERLPSDLRSRLESQGVTFSARWSRERWRAELGVDSREELSRLEERFPGLSLSLDGNKLEYRWHTSAIQPDRFGEPVFANAILAHLPAVRHPAYIDLAPYARPDNGVFFGDGEALSDQIINTLIDIQDAVAVNHRLQDGDLLVLDNSRVMHGRRANVADCPRRLLARFGYLPDN